MADEPEDDELLLEDEVEGDESEAEEPEQDEAQSDEPDEGEEDEEVDFSFGDEGAEQPANDEGESSVIKGFREREKKLQRRVRELEAGQPASAAPKEPGRRPTLAECDYDEERHEEAVGKWVADTEAFNAHAREQENFTQKLRSEYDAEKAKLNYPRMADAERNVFGEASERLQQALIYAKSPALVAALDRNPAQMAALEDIANPAQLLLAIGELKGKLRMAPRGGKKAPEPERIARGSASIAARGGDKTLERLEKQAEKAGNRDRSAIIAHKAAMRQRAA